MFFKNARHKCNRSCPILPKNTPRPVPSISPCIANHQLLSPTGLKPLTTPKTTRAVKFANHFAVTVSKIATKKVLTKKMQIVVNGRQQAIAEGTSLAELLKNLDLNAKQVAVEVNLQLVPRTEHAQHCLATATSSKSSPSSAAAKTN